MGRFLPREQVARARCMDLLEYMRIFEPDNLMRSGQEYRLKEHDSVVISNGLWCQKSTGIGGRSALDYLVKVRGLSLQDAVDQIQGAGFPVPTTPTPAVPARQKQPFRLPPKHKDNRRVEQYLRQRGIHPAVIDWFISANLLYESSIHHNAVFVGLDYQSGEPKYAALRGCGTQFRGDAEGSLKEFGFRFTARDSPLLHVFEAPVDLLSYATLRLLQGQNWMADNLLSLGGVAEKAAQLPRALSGFLAHNTVETIVLHLDNDAAGIGQMDSIQALCPPEIAVVKRPPPKEKDVNDYLLLLQNGVVIALA